MKPSPQRHRHSAQAGLSLIELMVAIVIALFILGGLAAVFVSMKMSFRSQDGLAQLEDNERLASTVLTRTIRAAGYFPNPVTLTPETALKDTTKDKDKVFGKMSAGQSILGELSATDGQVLSIRYATASGDGSMNCLGQTNTSGSVQEMLNTYRIAAGSNTLSCSTDGGNKFEDLVTGIESMDVEYCVDINPFGGSGVGPMRYLRAKDMTADLWNRVHAVKLTLNFTNPEPSKSPPRLEWVLAIDVMAAT